MLKSMAPNFCKKKKKNNKLFSCDNRNYGIKADIGVFQRLLGALCF